MLNFSKTASLLVIRTAQQFDTKPMHPSEKFGQNQVGQNTLVKFYFMKNFNFSDTRTLREKIFSLGFMAVQNIGSLRLCHVLLKQRAENVFVFR